LEFTKKQQEKLEEEKTQKMKMRQEEKSNRHFVKVGKPHMFRSAKKVKKVVKQDTKKLTEEEMDKLKYLQQL